MGGVPGYGPVVPEVDEPVFHDEWEGRIFGLVQTVRAGLSRRRLESLDPEEYLSGYYQRWMIAFERGLIERGVLSAEELDAKTEYFRNNPSERPTRIDDPEMVIRARNRMNRRANRCESHDNSPRFAVGESVATRRIRHNGHTRVPKYVQGKRGTVAAVYAPYEFPDDSAGCDADEVQWLYCVRFEGRELWEQSSEQGTMLFIDVWESHLETNDRSNEKRSDV